MDISPATPELLERFYGRRPERSVRAIAFMDGDRVVGVAGVYTDEVSKVMFSELNDEIRRDKRLMIRGIRAVQKMLGNVLVRSWADPSVGGSDRLLEHMGFEHVRDRVYVWAPPQLQ